MKRTITLTITKKYFDLILSGEKTTEYRKYIPHYAKKFDPANGEISSIIFHYRCGVYMYCIVKQIDLIERPPELANSPFITTSKCFAIRISSARLMK